MEQRRMHSQQLSHNAHDAASFDISQPPFYPSFPGLELQGDSKVTQAPHLSPSYVQHQYAHDTGASLESGGSPPLSFRIHEQPQQGHPRLGGLALPPAPQYHQPCPTETYSVFTHDHGGHNPTPQVPSHQFPRAPPHPAHWPIDPRATGPFSDNATSPHTAPAAPRMGIPPIYSPPYALRPQPMYPLPTIHPSTPTHGPPEQSQRTTTPAPTAFHEQHEDRANIDHAQRSRSWGAGSLDPTTGVFSRASDHPRIRTAQACEKCRARKAKCTGDHPACQRCLERGLECKYAAERRMRGPNKPKLPLPILSPLPDGSPQPPAAGGQKPRRRASTMPSASRRGMQTWGQQQQQQKQGQQQEQGIVTAASPASSASSGSGSRGFPPLSESEASPMTPHSLLDGRHSSGPSYPASPHVFVQHFSANMRSGMLGHVSEGNGYGDDGMGGTEGMVAGVYGHDIFADSTPSRRRSFESTKAPF